MKNYNQSKYETSSIRLISNCNLVQLENKKMTVNSSSLVFLADNKLLLM